MSMNTNTALTVTLAGNERTQLRIEAKQEGDRTVVDINIWEMSSTGKWKPASMGITVCPCFFDRISMAVETLMGGCQSGCELDDDDLDCGARV